MRCLFYLLVDIGFIAGLLAMSTCMDHSEFVYISEWIRQCKQSSDANQALPVLVLVLFIIMVLCQMDWMFCVAHLVADMPFRPPACDSRSLEGRVYIAAPTKDRENDTPKSDGGVMIRTFAMACKISSVIGCVLILHYDSTYIDSQHKLVLLHYYGVLLITGGLVGFIQIIWWKLEIARNHFNLSYGCRSYMQTPIVTLLQNLQQRSFFILDAVLVTAVLFFFVSTLFLRNQDRPDLHTWSIVAELILFAILAVQFMFLFYRCCALQDLTHTNMAFHSGEFMLLLCALSLPVVLIHALVIDDAPRRT